jgi:hypothetical protein
MRLPFLPDADMLRICSQPGRVDPACKRLVNGSLTLVRGRLRQRPHCDLTMRGRGSKLAQSCGKEVYENVSSGQFSRRPGAQAFGLKRGAAQSIIPNLKAWRACVRESYEAGGRKQRTALR